MEKLSLHFCGVKREVEKNGYCPQKTKVALELGYSGR